MAAPGDAGAAADGLAQPELGLSFGASRWHTLGWTLLLAAILSGVAYGLEAVLERSPRRLPALRGLAAIRQIAGEARNYLESGAMLALEHGFDQGEPARKLLFDLGYGDVSTARDLEGRERVSSGLRT